MSYLEEEGNVADLFAVAEERDEEIGDDCAELEVVIAEMRDEVT
jgi:hypothetical protein